MLYNEKFPPNRKTKLVRSRSGYESTVDSLYFYKYVNTKRWTISIWMPPQADSKSE